MTFIASVVSKKGVAVIADSLVTSMKKSLDQDQFISYLSQQHSNTQPKDTYIRALDLLPLFEMRASHTKDYEEKLFKYDSYTALTFAGAAMINGKRIEDLVNGLIEKNKKMKNYNRTSIETRVRKFSEFIMDQATEYLKTNDEISSGTTFIFSHFIKSEGSTEIYKVDLHPCNKNDNPSDLVSVRKTDDKVVCDGQNRISERILFGEIDFLITIMPKIIEKVSQDLGTPTSNLPENYIGNFYKNSRSFLPKQFFEDMKVNKLVGLSLQQAVDLANLLMRIEINFQKYTENIPTVGGVVKLAIIDKDGFRFISGDEILKPESTH